MRDLLIILETFIKRRSGKDFLKYFETVVWAFVVLQTGQNPQNRRNR
jgi:hypothetical protein